MGEAEIGEGPPCLWTVRVEGGEIPGGMNGGGEGAGGERALSTLTAEFEWSELLRKEKGEAERR